MLVADIGGGGGGGGVPVGKVLADIGDMLVVRGVAGTC